jgi:hypothetical protein
MLDLQFFQVLQEVHYIKERIKNFLQIETNFL